MNGGYPFTPTFRDRSLKSPFALIMRDQPVLRTASLTFLIAICISSTTFAQGPRLVRIDKAGGQRGTEFKLVCNGEGLRTVNDVLFYDEGLAVSKIESDDDTVVSVTIKADEELLPGEYPLRLLSPTGVSDLRTIHISPYRQAAEEEPNNSANEAATITPGITIHGLVDEGDVDLFKLELKKGERISAEVVGIRNTQYVFDSRLAVLDKNGNELTANDDCPLLYQDPMLSFVAPSDGTYFVQLREAAFGGDLDSVYQLHIGSHPRPKVCYPAGGMAGDEVTMTLIGDASGPAVITKKLPDELGTIDHHPQDEQGIAPTAIKLRVSTFPNSLEVEPNNKPDTATQSLVSLPVALNGILQTESDIDYFRFKAEAGESWNVSVYGHRIGSPVDTVVSIFDPTGRRIIINDDGANHDSRFRFTPQKSGEYLLAIRDHLGHGGEDYVYRIEFQPIEPNLELAVPILSENRQQQRQKIELARGGKMAVIVSARRENFFSDIEISSDLLPDGITIKSSRISKTSHLGYLLFEASEDAPLSSELFGVQGVGTTVDQSVHGSLKQKTGLAFGPPRRTVYHSIEVNKIPLTIIESGPFQLEVEQPRVPLARDGQLDLKVTAVRNNFDDEIELTLPILPPWIEIPEDGVKIPAGQNSTTFTITATSDAKPREWTVLMMGEGNVDGHEVFASSGEFTFEVVDPYLDLTIDKTIAQQGGTARVVCRSKWAKNENSTSQSASAIARLRGLPKHVDVPEVKVPVGAKSFAFDVAVGTETPASIHNTLYVEVEVPKNGSGVRQFLGRGGVLEVLAEGQKPRDSRSRLDILRAARNAKRPTVSAKTD